MYALLFYVTSEDDRNETLLAARMDTLSPRVLWFETLEEVRRFYTRLASDFADSSELAEYLVSFRPHVIQWDSMARGGRFRRAEMLQFSEDGAVLLCPFEHPAPSADGKVYCGVYMQNAAAARARELALPICSIVNAGA